MSDIASAALAASSVMGEVLTRLGLELLIFSAFIAGGLLLLFFLVRWASASPRLLLRLALCFSAGGAIATLALFAGLVLEAQVPTTVQDGIAHGALGMGIMGLLFLVAWRGGGDPPPPPDDGPPDRPDDPDPAGPGTYPWWPGFERELRDYERGRLGDRAGERERVPCARRKSHPLVDSRR